MGVPPRPPPELHRLLRAGAGRHHRPAGDRGPLREAVRRGRVVPAPLPDELRVPRRPPVLHVVLGRARAAAPRPGDHRRRRAALRAPPRVHAGVDARRRARDGLGRRRPARRRSPTCTTRPSSWPTSHEASALPALPFPLGAPTVPGGVEPPPPARKLGGDYDTAWARRFPARFTRLVLLESVLRPAVAALGAPERAGIDRLHGLGDGPVIFAANHHSHLDTPVLLTSIPEPWRHKVFVGRGGRLLLPQPRDRRRVRARHRRAAHRALQGHPPVSGPGGRPHR